MGSFWVVPVLHSLSDIMREVWHYAATFWILAAHCQQLHGQCGVTLCCHVLDIVSTLSATTRRRVLKKQTFWVVKKCCGFLCTAGSIATFAISKHCNQFWARWIHSALSRETCCYSQVSSSFNFACNYCISAHTCCMSCLSHPHW
jgi:hypothetical protein